MNGREELTKALGINKEQFDALMRVVKSAVSDAVSEEIRPLDNKIELLSGDIKTLQGDMEDYKSEMKNVVSAIIEIERREASRMLVSNYGSSQIVRRDRNQQRTDKFKPCGDSVRPSSIF